METADSKNKTAESILHALSIAGSDAWCFAPIDQNELTYCSQSFVDMWVFELDPPKPSGYCISLSDRRITDRLETLGLDRDWLCKAFRSSGALSEVQPKLNVVEDIKRVVLPDDDGRPTGVLLIFKKRNQQMFSKDAYSTALESKRQLTRLSKRELEILNFVFEGFTNKAIAAKACISEKTVEKHRSNIMRKMETRSMAALIRRVTEAKLVASTDVPVKNSVECD